MIAHACARCWLWKGGKVLLIANSLYADVFQKSTCVLRVHTYCKYMYVYMCDHTLSKHTVGSWPPTCPDQVQLGPGSWHRALHSVEATMRRLESIAPGYFLKLDLHIRNSKLEALMFRVLGCMRFVPAAILMRSQPPHGA